jgi:hypothetical protein
MADFCSFKTAVRAPATVMQPVIDPASWTAESLRDLSSWSYRITDADADEIAGGIAAVRKADVPLTAIGRDHFPLGKFGGLLGDVRRELRDGRGMVMLRNFPVDRFDREETAIAYLGLGTYLGHAMSQNRYGHILGHVKDLGGNYADANTRGYMTHAEMRFHSDGCDYVGLLCLETAKAGGESRVVSSITIYNHILRNRPDLAKALTEDFYRSRSGEVSPGDDPWIKQPIFSFYDGYFSAAGAGAAIDKAQSLPGVPKYTPAQKEAVALYRDLVDELALDMQFERGDIQFLNNFVMLHTRREYTDWDEPSRKRHLLRLWINDPDGRPVPPDQRKGRAGLGVRIAGVSLKAPLDAETVA